MRTLAFLVVLLATAPALADARQDFVIAKGQAAEKFIRKDYVGAKEAIGRALKLAADDGDRREAYQLLQSIAGRTGDVPAMTDAVEFQLPGVGKRSYRIDEVKRYVAFLRTNKALDSAVARYREKLVQSPDDFVALGVLAYSVEGAKSKEPETKDLNKRFEAANLKIARLQAQEDEDRAPRLDEAAAMGYATAAKSWADAEDVERVQLMLKKADEAPPLKDTFMLRLRHEHAGDALCLIGQVEEGVKQYEEAIKAEDTDLQKNWLKGKIKEVRMGKKPVP